MKLKDALNKYSGETVKLGSATSFVYCGKVENNICQILDDLSKKELERIVTFYQKTVKHDAKFEEFWEKNIENAIKNLNEETYRKKWTDAIREKKLKSLMDKKTREKVNDRKRTDAILATYPERIRTWTNYPERKVKEEYESIEGGMIVIFEGLEQGDYWTVEEYEKANKEGLNE